MDSNVRDRRVVYNKIDRKIENQVKNLDIIFVVDVDIFKVCLVENIEVGDVVDFLAKGALVLNNVEAKIVEELSVDIVDKIVENFEVNIFNPVNQVKIENILLIDKNLGEQKVIYGDEISDQEIHVIDFHLNIEKEVVNFRTVREMMNLKMIL